MTPAGVWGTKLGAALAAAVFCAFLFSLAGIDGVHGLVLVGLIALVFLSALRPDQALATLAIGVPVAAWLGRQWNPSVAWAETLVVAFCAGYSVRGLVRRPEVSNRQPDVLDAPVFLAAVVIIASLAVQLLVDVWRFGDAATLAGLRELIVWWYFLMPASGDPMDAAMRLLEALLLFKAAATATRSAPAFALRLAGWAVCGAAAAAGLNLMRLWEAAVRLEQPLRAFMRYIMTERLNVHYGDLNAAGSYFVLTLFVALGLTLAPKGRRWAPALLLIASSVWITGSRMAMMVGVLALLLPAGAWTLRIRRRSTRSGIVIAAAVLLALIAAAAAYAIPKRGNQQSALAAAQVRVELARTSLRMTASSPSFGVGIGRYYWRSGEFSSPELLRLFPPAIHENAHNNFLQILAELGVIGLAAFSWLLTTTAWLSARLLRADPRDPIRWGLVTGLLAFVLSWLGGHPLLIDEPAFTFWLLLGSAAGWAVSIAPARPTRLAAWAALGLSALVAASVPLRVVEQRAEFELEHRGVGLTPWQDPIDGVRYRLAGSSSSVFVPSEAQLIVVPLRSVASSPELRVRLSLDGRPADIVKVVADRWQHLRLRMPQERNAPRFRRLDLHVERPESEDSPVLLIGKIEPR